MTEETFGERMRRLREEAKLNPKEEEPKAPTALSSIRSFCLECVGTPHEVRRCCAFTCPLWQFRLGHKPQEGDPLMDPAHVRGLHR